MVQACARSRREGDHPERDAARDPRGAAAHDRVVMSFRVTRANVKQLVEAMGEVTTAWENARNRLRRGSSIRTRRRPMRMGARRGAKRVMRLSRKLTRSAVR